MWCCQFNKYKLDPIDKIVKTAVLISGEYRTFDICRSTMTILDNPDVDVYFSTWNKTMCKNELLGVDINEEITYDRVRAALRRNACILIEDVNQCVEQKYNSKMIHRWKTGFELIRASGVQYDYVLVVRPDLFFDLSNPKLDDLIADVNELQVGWYSNDGLLPDCVFGGRIDTVTKLFDRLSVVKWVTASEIDWHTWWAAFIEQIGIHATSFRISVGFTFCRYPVPQVADFSSVVDTGVVWRDSRIVASVRAYGREFELEHWSEDIIAAAERRFNFQPITELTNASDTQ